MRIISGKNKGKRLLAPKKLPVRPTTDMAKEGLFNILNNRYNFEYIAVLDLFAGTGNISYEFASRGSGSILAVDKNSNCIKFINNIVRALDFSITTLKSDVFKFLEYHRLSYDVIFADPPYDIEDSLFQELAFLVFQNNLLNKNGALIIEHSPNTSFKNHPNFIEERKYGGSIFSFLG